MKWTLIVFLLSLMAGYLIYDDFEPGVLAGKNVVITGASAGIGEQMAYHYARMGARLLITSRTEDNLKKVVAKCKKVGHADGIYLYHAADMSDPSSPAQLIQVAKEKLGGIDFLVLNHISAVAWQPWRSSAENLTLLEHTINVNFLAYVRLTSSAMKMMEQSNGSIVVVSSVSGKISQPYLTSYSSSKFALDGFFTGLRQEFMISATNIAITICYIGLTETASGSQMLRRFGQEQFIRMMSPESPNDVAYAIVRGGALRHREVRYPFVVARIGPLLYELMPAVMEKLGAVLYN